MLDVKRIENYETNKFFFDSFDIERIYYNLTLTGLHLDFLFVLVYHYL
jgi:hypothetical protein